MKKVFAIACLLVVLVSAMAVAQEAPNQAAWRFTVKADNGSGSQFMAAATFGVATNAKDGFGVDGVVSDTNDGVPAWTVGAGSRAIHGVFNNIVYYKDVKSTRSPLNSNYNAGMPAPNGGLYGTPQYPANTKVWDLRVFATPGVGDGVIRLQFFTVNSTTFPVATVPGKVGLPVDVLYTLKMVNNKGMEGAAANNTVWNIPIPTVHSTTVPFFTLTLPVLYLSGANSIAAVAEGYQMQLIQAPIISDVPEPGTVAAALALLAPAGFMFRRRRS